MTVGMPWKHYTPHAELAFKSIEEIRRDVNYGRLLRDDQAAAEIHLAAGFAVPLIPQYDRPLP